MIRRTVVPYTLALFFTAPFLAAADPPPAPDRTVLVAQDVPGTDELTSPQTRIAGVMTNESTCWQVAKVMNLGVPSQVFYCVEPRTVTPDPLQKVPRLTPKGKMVQR